MKLILTLMILGSSLTYAQTSKPQLNCSFRHLKHGKLIEELKVNKEFRYYDMDHRVSLKNKRFTFTLYATYLPVPTVGVKIIDHKKKTTTYFPEINERLLVIEDAIVFDHAPSDPGKGIESLLANCTVTEG